MSGFLEPLVCTGLIVAVGSGFFLVDKTLCDYLKKIYEYCEAQGIPVKQKHKEELLRCGKILDKGLRKQIARKKKNHIDRHNTGNVYRKELEVVFKILEKMKSKFTKHKHSSSVQFRRKVDEFNRRATPLMMSMTH
ncbi:MAG: hypothetical protein AABY22_31520 [Nanoarchaeota archaeon]